MEFLRKLFLCNTLRDYILCSLLLNINDDSAITQEQGEITVISWYKGPK